MLDGFDIAASSECQANFLWQVSGPRFADDDFLEQGVENYYKFLLLKNYSSLPLVPTYQIELTWHTTHMLVNTEKYNQDCIRLHGSTFHHDDSLNDRTKGSKLDLAFQATVQLWKKAHDGHDYVVPGGMYRGEPADIYYETKVWTPDLGYDAGDSYDFGISTNNNAMKWRLRDRRQVVPTISTAGRWRTTASNGRRIPMNISKRLKGLFRNSKLLVL